MRSRYNPGIRIRTRTSSQSRLDLALSILLVIAIITAISMTIYVIVSPKQGEKFTEFYILGRNGTAADYPTELRVGEQGEVIIGVVNHEYATVSYRLVVQLNGTTLYERILRLADNETWEQPFSFKPERSGSSQKLEFLLYKLEREQYTNQTAPAYRSLHLWVDVTPRE